MGITQSWLDTSPELDLFNDFFLLDESPLAAFSNNPVLAPPPNCQTPPITDGLAELCDNELDQMLQFVASDPNFDIDNFISV